MVIHVDDKVNTAVAVNRPVAFPWPLKNRPATELQWAKKGKPSKNRPQKESAEYYMGLRGQER